MGSGGSNCLFGRARFAPGFLRDCTGRMLVHVAILNIIVHVAQLVMLTKTRHWHVAEPQSEYIEDLALPCHMHSFSFSMEAIISSDHENLTLLTRSDMRLIQHQYRYSDFDVFDQVLMGCQSKLGVGRIGRSRKDRTPEIAQKVITEVANCVPMVVPKKNEPITPRVWTSGIVVSQAVKLQDGGCSCSLTLD